MTHNPIDRMDIDVQREIALKRGEPEFAELLGGFEDAPKGADTRLKNTLAFNEAAIGIIAQALKLSPFDGRIIDIR